MCGVHSQPWHNMHVIYRDGPLLTGDCAAAMPTEGVIGAIIPRLPPSPHRAEPQCSHKVKTQLCPVRHLPSGKKKQTTNLTLYHLTVRVF